MPRWSDDEEGEGNEDGEEEEEGDGEEDGGEENEDDVLEHEVEAHVYVTRIRVPYCAGAGMDGLLVLATAVAGGPHLIASGARRHLNHFIVIGLEALR